MISGTSPRSAPTVATSPSKSLASNLVAGDTNGTYDIFVRDRQTGETRRVSVSSAGAGANEHSRNPTLSADGRFVSFSSRASNLVAGDTNRAEDVFVHDRQTGETQRVSVTSAGEEADRSSVGTISADGRYVGFSSSAANLVAGDNNAAEDVFVHDRQSGETRRLSFGSTGAEANDYSNSPVISADGRFVAFPSFASNLVPVDTNRTMDIFVHNLDARDATPPFPNPGFETDLAGWNASGSAAGVTLTRVSGGHSGGWAAKLTNTGTSAGSCTLNDAPNAVKTTAAGTYTARLWVRADSPGLTLEVRLREYSGATLLGSEISEVVLTTA
jgi:Tol biopolymer transport system component